ncbi:hypothetical protein [Rhizobium sp. CNPSo 3490]|uniref:hypothetical protein n=1 Tax=Rhizobium sp. CNPSo 3490 TaxID=3021407 RepID=UPI00254C593E|nr:hypothetical protein [Rhizobium sp. CNPSo 3490]MDK4734579.1 hypothetical protein [Rhizobium sp. CNPSo 3490]
MRLPMQWWSEKKAGFSSANVGKLCQPIVADGPFSYKTEIDFSGMQPRKFRDLIGDVEFEGILQPRPELEPYANHWFVSEGNGS